MTTGISSIYRLLQYTVPEILSCGMKPLNYLKQAKGTMPVNVTYYYGTLAEKTMFTTEINNNNIQLILNSEYFPSLPEACIAGHIINDKLVDYILSLIHI